MKRSNIVYQTSLVSIVVNGLLALTKILLGILTSSVAVSSDGFNNLSDSLSSVVTLLGAKLANKKPDHKHPLGYGRIEYLTSIVMSVLILYAGLEATIESLKAILHQQQTTYSTLSFILLGVALVVKAILGFYVIQQGKKANSASLIASGHEARIDALMSASVLISAILSDVAGIYTEAYLALILSLFILKAGYELLKETLSQLLGERGSQEISSQLESILSSFSQVRGMYDLFVHQYGQEQLALSFHIEIDEQLSLIQVDQLERQIQNKIYQDTGYIVTAIGVYAHSQQSQEVQAHIKELLSKYPWFVNLHGVQLTKEKLRLDVVVDFSIETNVARQIILDELAQEYSQSIELVIDLDSSD